MNGTTDDTDNFADAPEDPTATVMQLSHASSKPPTAENGHGSRPQLVVHHQHHPSAPSGGVPQQIRIPPTARTTGAPDNAVVGHNHEQHAAPTADPDGHHDADGTDQSPGVQATAGSAAAAAAIAAASVSQAHHLPPGVGVGGSAIGATGAMTSSFVAYPPSAAAAPPGVVGAPSAPAYGATAAPATATAATAAPAGVAPSHHLMRPFTMMAPATATNAFHSMAFALPGHQTVFMNHQGQPMMMAPAMAMDPSSAAAFIPVNVAAPTAAGDEMHAPAAAAIQYATHPHMVAAPGTIPGVAPGAQATTAVHPQMMTAAHHHHPYGGAAAGTAGMIGATSAVPAHHVAHHHLMAAGAAAADGSKIGEMTTTTTADGMTAFVPTQHHLAASVGHYPTAAHSQAVAAQAAVAHHGHAGALSHPHVVATHHHHQAAQAQMASNISGHPLVGAPVPTMVDRAPSPEMPIRPLSAYNFFFSDEREKILKEGNSGLNTDEQQKQQEEGKDGSQSNKDADGSKEGDTSNDKKKEETEQEIEARKQRLLDAHLRKDRTVRRPHRKTHGKIGFTSLSKMIGKRWRELPEDKKQFYREVAAMDMDRYQRSVAEYNNERLSKRARR